jgi:hypothetical protein
MSFKSSNLILFTNCFIKKLRCNCYHITLLSCTTTIITTTTHNDFIIYYFYCCKYYHIINENIILFHHHHHHQHYIIIIVVTITGIHSTTDGTTKTLFTLPLSLQAPPSLRLYLHPYHLYHYCY